MPPRTAPRSRRPSVPPRLALVVVAGLLAGTAGCGGVVDGRAPAGGAPSHASSAPAGKGSGEPLAGRVILLDPGHNPHNAGRAAQINRLVDVGNGRKPCDTAGTGTDGGYAEAEFTLDVVRRARRLLRAEGARVVLTQDGDRPYGPCVDARAAAGNRVHADAAVSVHADGAPAGHRGFHVIAPGRVRAGRADTAAITAPSRALGETLATRFEAATGEPRADYVAGGSGLDVRTDLGGLNLSTVPKVFVECGNMRDPQDARRLTSAGWRQRAARGIAAGLTKFLHGGS
ncbi:N-acetylmuramoyl-L-alanine amidase [Streptomyces sp. NPDC059740]|uniref:N-acetylmuramoyl-L-alanine amidase n=1 Tax=Streptomyces sp. NPDC059740 TaxID=3346926 RepID=UPI003656D6E5